MQSIAVLAVLACVPKSVQSIPLVPPAEPQGEVMANGSAPAAAQPTDAKLPGDVHWSKVEAIYREIPKYPEAARQLGIGTTDCSVRLQIDAKGAVLDAVPTSCAELFRETAVTAARQWRFKPYSVDGVPQGATFVIKFVYKFDNAEGLPELKPAHGR